MAENSLLMRVVAASFSAANCAGKIIRDVLMKGDLGIVQKGADDLQTEADRSAQKCIIASLSAKFPKLTIIGEENVSLSNVSPDWIANHLEESIISKPCPSNFKDTKEEDIVVWVDPLDGTKEYAQGFLENVTVLIGVAIGDRPVGGVIHQPFYTRDGVEGRTIWGINGVGVGGFTPSTPTEKKLILATTRSHSTPIAESALLLLKPDQILRVGGAGYKVLLLLEGRAHVYLFASPGCNRWDTCAPEAILSCLNGKLTDVYGNPYNYSKETSYKNSTGVLAAATPEIHEMCKKLIPKNILE